MQYDVQLYGERGEFVGTVSLEGDPSLLRLVKVRFEGEVQGGPPSMFGGERFFVRREGTTDTFDDITTAGSISVLPSQVVRPQRKV